MKTYIIARTYNGEGYTMHNSAYKAKFADEAELQAHLNKVLQRDVSDMGNCRITEGLDHGLRYEVLDEDGEPTGNGGTVQAFAIEGSMWGVRIATNINEVTLIRNAQTHLTMLGEALEQADPEEPNDCPYGHEFVPAYLGDCDYLFILLADNDIYREEDTFLVMHTYGVVRWESDNQLYFAGSEEDAMDGLPNDGTYHPVRVVYTSAEIRDEYRRLVNDLMAEGVLA